MRRQTRLVTAPFLPYDCAEEDSPYTGSYFMSPLLTYEQLGDLSAFMLRTTNFRSNKLLNNPSRCRNPTLRPACTSTEKLPFRSTGIRNRNRAQIIERVHSKDRENEIKLRCWKHNFQAIKSQIRVKLSATDRQSSCANIVHNSKLIYRTTAITSIKNT